MRDVSILTKNEVDIEKSLELFGDMETFDETLETFLIEVDKKIEELKKHKENEDMHNYSIYAHSLKTDARYFGFDKLAETSLEHELKSKEGKMSFVYDNFDSFMEEINKVIKISKQYLGKLPVESDLTVSVSHEETSIKKSILVVDDSNLIGDFITRIFKDSYNIIRAIDGGEAIDILQTGSENISCMLLDLNMPRVDGFAVLEYFKDNNLFGSIPISIITGNDTRDNVDRAFTYPIIDMIQKPFDEQKIKSIVERTINFGSL